MQRVVERGSEQYPSVFEALEDPPGRLFVRGPIDLSRPRVAVVGTRRPTERGRRLAQALGRGLASAGVVVVSGGALGIDGAAHRGAVEAGGVTWVVLPTPLDAPGPRRHHGLFQRVLDTGGAWWSELAAHGGKRAFYQRNRLVAALGAVLVVVEAQLGSGTAHSVAFARALSRPVAAYPWAVGDPAGAGCLAWLREGAELVRGPQDVLALVDEVAPDRPRPARPPLVAALGARGMTPEALARTLSRPVADVLAELSLLELEGQVRACPGGRFVDVAVDGR